MTSAAPATDEVRAGSTARISPEKVLQPVIGTNAFLAGTATPVWTGNVLSNVKDVAGNLSSPEESVARQDGTSSLNTLVSPGSADRGFSSTLDDEVDSALLAALRDPRERLALLKLEKVLIDFLQEQPEDTYIDVGGPYNSIVFSPTRGPIGETSAILANANANNNNLRPQTTFQRCILHRLCDRFRMTREKSYVNHGFGYYIRIVKGTDSGLPHRLLLSIQPSEYAQPDSESIQNTVSTNPIVNFEITGAASSNVDIEATSCNQLVQSSGAVPSVAKSSSGKPRKMKIMKRSSNTNASAKNGGNQKTNTNSGTRHRNSLSEKEKKYAEARARIFQQEESAATSTDTGTLLRSEQSTESTIAGLDAMNIHGDKNKAASNTSSRSSTPTRTPPRSGLNIDLQGSLGSSSSIGAGSNMAEQKRKATYRNRQQEEADPDFRRGVAMRVTPPVATTWNAAASPFYPPQTTGYYGQQSQSHHLHQNHQHPAYGTQHFVGMAAPPGVNLGFDFSYQRQGGLGIAMVTGNAGSEGGNGAPRYGSGPSAANAATAAVDLPARENFPALR